MTQNERLIDYLRTHDDLSVAEAPAAIGIGCLTKRISECRRAGYNIKSREVTQKSPWGGVTRYNRYYLEE